MIFFKWDMIIIGKISINYYTFYILGF